MKDCIHPRNRFRCVVIVSIWGVCFLSILNCTDIDKKGTPPTVDLQQTVVRDGYTIQLFSSPEEQLRNSMAWFSDPKEKIASLQVLIDRVPASRLIRAEAQLELAYLALGSDYRFTSREESAVAISKYQAIIEKYSDIPSVCAKANWYIGWILADLLDKPREAAFYYHVIVDQYHDSKLNLKPPVPWVSLVFPQVETRPQIAYERPTYYWGSIALLELIRISDDESEKWAAFQKLYAKYRSSLATGYAMRELLYGPPALAQKTVAYAQNHLNAMLFGSVLAKEIPKLLRTIKLSNQGGSNQQIKALE